MENKEDKPKSGKGVWRGPENLANRNGRPPGAKNKNTELIREAYQNLTTMNLDNMSEWLMRIAETHPERAFKLMLEMSEFIIPKINRTELTAKDGNALFENLKFEFGPSVKERLNSLDGIETIDFDDV